MLPLPGKLSGQWKKTGGVGVSTERIEAEGETRSNQTYQGALRQYTRNKFFPRGDTLSTQAPQCSTL